MQRVSLLFRSDAEQELDRAVLVGTTETGMAIDPELVPSPRNMRALQPGLVIS